MHELTVFILLVHLAMVYLIYEHIVMYKVIKSLQRETKEMKVLVTSLSEMT